MRLSDLQHKDVVNMLDGKKIKKPPVMAISLKNIMHLKIGQRE